VTKHIPKPIKKDLMLINFFMISYFLA